MRQHDKICETIVWRTGVLLVYEGMKVLIKADIEDGKIQIAITGKGRRRQLCFERDVDYEILEGSNLDGKVQEFILRMNRRGRVPDLLSALNQLP